MALLINSDCINCTLCEEVCPNEAVSRGEETFVIDPARCTECVGFFEESQCIDVCPAYCIEPDPEHPASKGLPRMDEGLGTVAACG